MLIHAYSCQTWQSVKLVKANAILSKIRYFATFNSHLSYLCTGCGQSIVLSHECTIYREMLYV